MHEHQSGEPVPTGRLAWLEPIASQVAGEVEATQDEYEQIEDLVVMAFEGLLNDPRTGGAVTYQALFDRAQQEAELWRGECSSQRRLELGVEGTRHPRTALQSKPPTQITS